MAGFVKLHSSILRSTIWFARPDREIFITALLMAEPREIMIPTPQLMARTLDPTGWVVPPGWYGFCETSGPGILRLAGIEVNDTGFAALERLGSPEPESRSQAFDGRRLVRVDGGWIALNYDKYRSKDTTCADRAARYRARRAVESSRRDVTGEQRDVTGEQRDSACRDRDVTQAEAEAEAEEEKKKQRRARKARSTLTQPPDQIEPTEATLAVATATGRSWRQDWDACRDWALGKGERRADWQATLRGWMRREADRVRASTPLFRNGTPKQPPQPNDENNRYRPRHQGDPK